MVVVVVDLQVSFQYVILSLRWAQSINLFYFHAETNAFVTFGYRNYDIGANCRERDPDGL